MKINRKLIHWIAIFAILMSSLAPTISQAVSLAKGQQGFVMEVCSAEGNKFSVVVGDHNESDITSFKSTHCPYCIAHTAITPAFNANFTFQAPQALALLPQLFYQSPKPLAVWVTPPSAAPPTQA